MACAKAFGVARGVGAWGERTNWTWRVVETENMLTLTSSSRVTSQSRKTVPGSSRSTALPLASAGREGLGVWTSKSEGGGGQGPGSWVWGRREPGVWTPGSGRGGVWGPGLLPGGLGWGLRDPHSPSLSQITTWAPFSTENWKRRGYPNKDLEEGLCCPLVAPGVGGTRLPLCSPRDPKVSWWLSRTRGRSWVFWGVGIRSFDRYSSGYSRCLLGLLSLPSCVPE